MRTRLEASSTKMHQDLLYEEFCFRSRDKSARVAMDFQPSEIDLADDVLNRLALLRAGDQFFQLRFLLHRNFFEVYIERLATEHMRGKLFDGSLGIPVSRRFKTSL